MPNQEKDKKSLNHRKSEDHLSQDHPFAVRDVNGNNDNLFKMVNASRASRNLPLEFIMDNHNPESKK